MPDKALGAGPAVALDPLEVVKVPNGLQLFDRRFLDAR
jgi:hypothetical protein